MRNLYIMNPSQRKIIFSFPSQMKFSYQQSVLQSNIFANYLSSNSNLFSPSFSQLSSTAKVARWFAQLPWNPPALSRPESGFVSGDSRSERNHKSDGDGDHQSAKEHDIEQDFTDEFFLVEGTRNIWSKLSVKKRKKLLSLKLGKVTTF
jgi:hypothetical protein